MAKKYLKLRAKLLELDIDRGYLAKKLGVSAQSISNRMNDHFPWTSWEMYATMALINEPPEKLHEYFPASANNPKLANSKGYRTFR